MSESHRCGISSLTDFVAVKAHLMLKISNICVSYRPRIRLSSNVLNQLNNLANSQAPATYKYANFFHSRAHKDLSLNRKE